MGGRINVEKRDFVTFALDDLSVGTELIRPKLEKPLVLDSEQIEPRLLFRELDVLATKNDSTWKRDGVVDDRPGDALLDLLCQVRHGLGLSIKEDQMPFEPNQKLAVAGRRSRKAGTTWQRKTLIEAIGQSKAIEGAHGLIGRVLDRHPRECVFVDRVRSLGKKTQFLARGIEQFVKLDDFHI